MFIAPNVGSRLFVDSVRGACTFPTTPLPMCVCVCVDSVVAGEYAYCTVIKALDGKNPRYRVLALSATPGTDILKVQDVLQALHISHIEVGACVFCRPSDCFFPHPAPTVLHTEHMFRCRAQSMRADSERWRP